MDMDICLCAIEEENSLTEFYVFPLWDTNNQTFYHHPRRNKSGWEEIMETSAVSDHHQHSIEEVVIKKLWPCFRFFMSPNRENVFAVINTVVYVIVSRIFPEKFLRHPPGTGRIDPIPSGSTVIDGGHHLYRCLIGPFPAMWEPCPPMKASRLWGCYPIVVDGKIHVVGGNENRIAEEPIHEAFDPVSLQWTTLAPPPSPWYEDTCNMAFRTAVVDNPTRLIVGPTIANNLYIYHVSKDCWEILSPPDCKNQPFYFSGPAAVAGQTLYWFDYQKFRLVAFDLEEQKWLRGRICGLDDGQKHFGSTSDFPSLLHIVGDLFCLLWTSDPNNAPVAVPRNSDSDSDDSDYNGNNVASSSSSNENTATHIHCATIEVSKVIPYVKGKHGLSASIVSCQCYVVDRYVSCFGAFIMRGAVNNERMSF